MSRGMDVVAAADDEVLLAADDLQVAALRRSGPRSPLMNQPPALNEFSVAAWLSK